MNKARRTRLASIKEQLEERLQELLDEEQEAMDNVP